MKTLLAMLLSCLAVPAFAQAVYRYVEDGITTFSDAPPEDGPAELISIDAPPAVDDGLLALRLQQMRETTQLMAEDRRERERQRAELRALSSAQQNDSAAITQAQPSSAVVAGYWPAFGRWGSALRPPLRRQGFVHRRPIPYATPQAPPGWSVMRPGNAQLMRPIVSRRNRAPN